MFCKTSTNGCFWPWTNKLGLTLPAHISDGEKKLIFIFILFCGVSKDFMKAFKVFIKPWGTTKECENKNLTLSWRRPLSMDWFLYDNGLRHKRVKLIFNLGILTWKKHRQIKL